MTNSKKGLINKIHLVISILVVAPAAICYGFYPNYFLELQPNSLDESNMLKAVMGLYLAFAMIWLIGLARPSLLRIAQVTNMVFMLGLGFGRLCSIIIDGIPSTAFAYGTLGELVLGLYGFWVLYYFNRTKS